MNETILVIRLSAFGDVVNCFPSFAAIRRHHPAARIVLLTTRPYADLARQSPWFDAVWIDTRPKPWNVPGMWRLIRMLRSCRFQRVYDLQTSGRTSKWYHRLVRKPVEWSGVAPGCSHPHANPERGRLHARAMLAEQLAFAGVTVDPPYPDLTWLERDLSHLNLPQPYALMCPGAAAHRPEKRWPALFFAEVAHSLVARGLTPVLVGGAAEEQEIAAIVAHCPQARSLCGQTRLEELYSLGKGARLALGNDTGPMHMFAMAGCPSLVLFSADSDPTLCAPRGPGGDGQVRVLQQASLSALLPEKVIAALADLA